MARIWACGFELNSSLEYLNPTGSVTFSTTTVRTGSFSLQITSLASGVAKAADNTFSGGANGPYYQSVYINIATLPSAENRIFAFNHLGGVADSAYITLDNTGVLRLYDDVGVIGSPSSALSLNTWTKLDLKMDRSLAAGSQVVEGRINNVVFATASNRTITNTVDRIRCGGNLNLETQTQGNWFFDDWKVNDGTGSFENSYPGTGGIIHLHPDSVGDNNDWTRGGVDSGANWSQVNEITPNDLTNYVTSNTLNQTDDYNLGASGLGAATINLVATSIRVQGVGASANASFVLRIKASAAGTVEESATLTPSNATFRTNRVGATPVTLQQVLYDLPGASTSPWTSTDLDAAQIGIRLSAASTNAVNISTLWLLVDFTAASSGLQTSPTQFLMLMGLGT